MAENEKEKDEDLLKSVHDLISGTEAEDDEEDFDDSLEMNTPEEQIEALEAQRDEFRDRFMRALADAENSRKRGERDRREAEKYGGSKLARDMLPVFDSLARTIETASEEQKAENAAFFEGVELTMRELLNVFGKHGIEAVIPEIGDKFDPQHHQAMFEAPLPDTKQGDIIQVTASGFLLHDRLLRPAQVGVSSNPDK